MIDLIEKGGIMMYPIILSSCIVTAVIIERAYTFFIKTKFITSETIEKVFLLAGKGENEKAISILHNENSVFSIVFISILEQKEPADMEEAAIITGEEVLFGLGRHLPVLSIMGSALPLMGLLGTVLGMIKVFARVAAAGDAADITVLAGGIWEALITTAAGMIIAIPTILVYHFFRRKIEKMSHFLQQKASTLVMIIKNRKPENDKI